MSLRTDKDALRARMRELRAALPEDERAAAADRVAERLVRAVGDEPKGVMIFLSFGSELPTDPICERLAAEGHRILVPHIADREVVPVAYEPGEPLIEASWGIREPADRRTVDPSAIDLVAAPGLAFDRHGFRVGYGGGFYDRLLARTREDCARAGIGFHFQVVADVPHGSKDQPLQMVLTDRETIVCARPGLAGSPIPRI